jgi:hypothetical protein
MEREYKTPNNYLLKVLRPLIPKEDCQENIYSRQESIMAGFVSFLCYMELILETMKLIMPIYIYSLNINHAKMNNSFSTNRHINLYKLSEISLILS